MPIKEQNNDQNIERVFTKMSEDSSTQNNKAKLTDCIENANYLNNIDSEDNKDDSNLSYDHMYATNNVNVDINPEELTCQNAESEVKFLKEWLLMHLDLIQQQNDEILNKEKTILILKQENEMLRERINCLDPGVNFESDSFNKRNSKTYSYLDTLEEMTQDAAHIDDDNKADIYFQETHKNSPNNCLDGTNYEVNSESYNTLENTSNNCDTEPSIGLKIEKGNTSSANDDTLNSTYSASNSLHLKSGDFVVNSSVEDTLNNLKMSIRRKRLCSTSSALSNTEVSSEDIQRSKKKKKRKNSLKDDKILTCSEQYVTQTGESGLGIPINSSPVLEIPSATNLEVPRWRVKLYTSCYTMEGTENLDDEVYNKRHMRLENDERRRKRWDVQRIREQRIIEKLKQRQERVGSNSRTEENLEPVQTLWPSADDIKFLEVSDHLPVSAFGVPIPKFTPSEFSLPWLNNPYATLKRNSNRKSTIRRKATKR